MAKLYEANNHILIHADYMNPAKHCHMAAHIIISLHDMMKVKLDNKQFLCHGITIPSGVNHWIDTFGKPVLVFLYDSTTDVAKQIQYSNVISKEVCNEIASWYLDFEKYNSRDEYSKFMNCFLNQLNMKQSKYFEIDDRIISAMKYIRSNLSEKITCQEVADLVFLSQGRFSHLFKSQVGMTFASYVIYQRIMYVYTEIVHGKSITEAALEAGFSSSSHFSDVNRRVFGLAASIITDELQFIKIG